MPLTSDISSALSATQSLSAPPHVVFPLLCPVREYDWIEDWSCKIVSSRSGIAEPNCVFTTKRDYGHSEPIEEVWIVSRYEPERVIEFVKFCEGLYVIKYDIHLAAKGEQGTYATWTQTRIPLSDEGAEELANATGDAFETMIETLEGKLNYFLETGERMI